ncbi:MAG: helix-turn-helix domain-containing protein [Oscillospiraceae bacterium]|jgi:transcriptional regulator with XRE-family HTH domain|nr:helix-turn-helix domain-containing protein [Oscillospiraceae bacterium]
MDFSKRLHELREDSDLKQIKLAQKLHLKPSVVSKYENGKVQPSIDTLIKLSEIFSVSVDYLFGLSDIKNPYTAETFMPKEVNLILRFRRLSDDQQIRIDERINTILAL